MKKSTKLKVIRYAIQLASFLLFPGLFAITFSSIGDIVSSLISGTFTMQSNGGELLLGSGILLITAIFGRFFCGYVCSFGALQDLTSDIGRLLRLPQIKIPQNADKPLRILKYIVLAAIAVFCWILGIKLASTVNPWEAFGKAITVNSPDFTALLSIGGAVLIVIMTLSMFLDRAFCRYLCPLGGILAPISHFRVFRIRKPSEKCGKCRVCTESCPMGISLQGFDKVTSDECINCLSCAAACPRANITADPAPAVSTAIAVLSITGFRYLGTIDALSSSATSSAVVSLESETGPYEDGTYAGSAQGYRGTTEVTVTVTNGYIQDISVDSYKDDDEFFSKAKSTVIDEIISSQSTDVATVTGATFSSNGIIEAVADALGTVSASTDSVNSTSDEGSSSTSVTETTETSSDSEQTSAGGTYSDGTYTGSGTGLRGTTNVSVTVANGQITDITVESYEDDQEYFSRAQSTVIDEILDSQSIDVSTVSGATFSSNGIIEAVADALGVDFTNPNSSVSQGENGGFGHGSHGH